MSVTRVTQVSHRDCVTVTSRSHACVTESRPVPSRPVEKTWLAWHQNARSVGARVRVDAMQVNR